MKTTPLERRTPLRQSEKPLARTSRLARATSKPRRRPVSPATPAQKAKVTGLACVAAGHDTPCRGTVDPMHLIDRSLAPSAGDDVLMVVPCCRGHHDAYDAHELDLSPFLEPRWREEAACAVRAVGLFSAVRRITGKHWLPADGQL